MDAEAAGHRQEAEALRQRQDTLVRRLEELEDTEDRIGSASAPERDVRQRQDRQISSSTQDSLYPSLDPR